MTEGTGYVIDPNGDARRALHDVVAAQGPQALSDPAIMERVCRDRLAGLPGESALIGSAVRADVPARLREQIPGWATTARSGRSPPPWPGRTSWTTRRPCGWSGSTPGPWG